MKVKYKSIIDGYVIVLFIDDAVVDTEETIAKVESLITSEMTQSDIENLFMSNLVYAKLGPEAELIDDQNAEMILAKLALQGKHQLLLDNDYEYIPDHRGTEYWIKKSGKWKQEKIEKLGISLPAGAVLQVSPEQQLEISNQKEVDRIAALTPEQKAEEKKNRLYALAREASRRAEDADFLGETFDKKVWFVPKKAEIEALYT